MFCEWRNINCGEVFNSFLQENGFRGTDFFLRKPQSKLCAMTSKHEQPSKKSRDLNLEKDDKTFPASQFSKDQRKDAEKVLKEASNTPPSKEKKNK